VDIQVPIFQDENTNVTEPTEREPYPGKIYMDGMHFGMGCSCLQVTYETQNVNHARFLYDMFLPFTPIMSALSATTPLVKGQISDHDFRWEILEQSVDCRTADEKDRTSVNHICKSRYSTVSRYISNHEYIKDFHNDITFKAICPEVKSALVEGGLDDRLANHVASLFIRIPIPVYEKELAFPCCAKATDEILDKLGKVASPNRNQDADLEIADQSSPGNAVEEVKSDGSHSATDEVPEKSAANKDVLTDVTSSSSFLGKVDDNALEGICTAWFLKCPPMDGNSHFENLQSTNWNSLRFKNPPTEDSDIGWRVEFRPMDI